MTRKKDKAGEAKPHVPIAGGASESYLEIDATEYAEARRDPAVRKLLEKADRYAESLRAQGRLDDR
jgi:hypothetical protein